MPLKEKATNKNFPRRIIQNYAQRSTEKKAKESAKTGEINSAQSQLEFICPVFFIKTSSASPSSFVPKCFIPSIIDLIWLLIILNLKDSFSSMFDNALQLVFATHELEPIQ